MVPTCGLRYVPLSDDVRADNSSPIGAQSNDVVSAANTTSKKYQPLWSEIDVDQLDRHSNESRERLRSLKYKFKLPLLLLLACVLGLGFGRSHRYCHAYIGATRVQLSSRGQNTQPAVEETFISRAKPSSSPILEVFQVYLPVLAPYGITDQTTESNGSSNTTSIGSAETSATCTQLLMEYSFGFSYGHPFVGMFFHLQGHFYQMLTTITRQLFSAIMPIQSSCHELYCHFSRTAI